MDGYIALVEGKRYEVYADSSYQASIKAKALYTGRKKYPSVDVYLVELDGSQVTTTITD